MADLTDRLANFAMEDPELCRIWLVQVLSSPDPTRDRLWKEYEGSTARFARTKLAQGALHLASSVGFGIPSNPGGVENHLDRGAAAGSGLVAEVAS